MDTGGDRRRLFIWLQFLLVGTLLGSSSPSSAALFRSVTSMVGEQVVLPCSWRSRLGRGTPDPCHVQWTTLANTVFEQAGANGWQAEEFEGRMEVPMEKLRSGDCSLIISDTQIGDTGRYESYMVVDGVRSEKTRVFIQAVKLSVSDHKSLQSRALGEDLVLDLHTGHSLTVVFQSRNSSEWTVLWMRGDKAGTGRRVEKHPLKEQLTLKNLRSSDNGLYKVLDNQGLAVSTVQLYIEEMSPALKVQQVPENEIISGDATSNGRSALLVPVALVTSLQIPRLL